MRQLSSLDTQFLAVEDGCAHGHVMALSILDPSTAPDGRLTRKMLMDLVSTRIDLLPPLYSRLAPVPLDLDLPYWVTDDRLDLHHHIREIWAPPDADDRALAAIAAEVASRPLDRAHPLWELHLIHGLPHGRVGLLTKLHHAAIDGVSGEELVATLLDSEPNVPPRTPRPLPEPERPSDVAMLARGLIGLPQQPVRAARGALRVLPHLDLVPNVGSLPGVPALAGVARRLKRSTSDGAVLERPAQIAPRTRFNDAIGPRRAVGYCSMSLDEVKTIKRTFGVTVNDVVMAIVTGGMRRWLADRGELPDQQLTAIVPISVRVPGGATEFGNQIGMLFTALPTDQDDPVARVLQVSQAMTAAKEHHRAVPATLLQDANHFIPPAVFGRAARGMMRVASQPNMAVGANLLVSNVPGSPQPLYMAGARLVAQYPVSAIFHALALNITVLSYCGQMDWGVVCAEDQDAWSLIAALEAAQAELVALTATTATNGAAK